MTSASAAASARSDRLQDLLRLAPVIPVITIERVEDGVPLARALVSGGLRLLEITLRTPAGVEGGAKSGHLAATDQGPQTLILG
jgi:2-dehydro-3-deoxyphosphogluconate aldolase / (4S)-4-hydroxy-2-oxoglutarate aldolase